MKNLLSLILGLGFIFLVVFVFCALVFLVVVFLSLAISPAGFLCVIALAIFHDQFKLTKAKSRVKN